MFKRAVESKYQIKAGPGAGVNVEIQCELSWDKKGTKIVFAPTKANVTFHSYYNTSTSTEYGQNEGLKIAIDPIADKDDVESFENRMGDSGSVKITEKNKLYDAENTNRTLVLSGGYIRHQYNTGDSFDFALCLDNDYYIFVKGTATFLVGGQDAWDDLDRSNDDEDED